MNNMETIATATLTTNIKAENCDTNEQVILYAGTIVDIKASPYMTRADYHLIDHNGYQTIAHDSELHFN